jgi:CBS domain-containing protein
MKAGALMTSDPRTCQPEDDLHCAARIMKTENCGIVPVTKGHGETQVMGVVTDRDIALYLGTTDAKASTVMVKEVMSTSLAFCAPETDVREVSRRMQDAQVRRILVLEGRRLVGVISTADLARATGYGLGIGEEVRQIVVEVSRPTTW